MIVSFSIKKRLISYVGYTNNVKKRLISHNNSKGAKFTRGKKWYLAYYEEFNSKKKAMKEQYKLKKNFNKRLEIKNNYLKKKLFNFNKS